MEHWDGSSWTLVPGPSFYQAALGDAAASGPDDIWAVGAVDNFSSAGALAIHWAGSTWQQVSVPTEPNIIDASLGGIAALAPGNVWAAGTQFLYNGSSYEDRTLIVHWDGSVWNLVSSPNGESGHSFLSDIAAVAPDDIWAVGTDGPSPNQRSLILHWDGTAWSIVPSPQTDQVNHLSGVTAIASNDVWAVGYQSGPISGPSRPLVLHWDGSAWSTVDAPSYGMLRGITAAPDGLWSVGSYRSRPLIFHWDGLEWSQAATPNFDPGYSELIAASPAPDGSVWAAGYHELESYSTLVARYSGDQCCAPPFSDVQTTDFYYGAVHYLYCQGMISGYADGTFRPNASITRGQLSKIVVSAAGLFLLDPEIEPRRDFQDVPLDHPFYTWITSLAFFDYIEGYPCGGPNEPCVAPDNLPYFRPNANVTRGQMAKIVANAVRIQTNPAGQTFADVPANHPFYLWVERLASQGVMSGYPCGGLGEPCDSQQRPYFRTGNNATRGQASKIVHRAIIPPEPTPVISK
jgi:hypothetical protein